MTQLLCVVDKIIGMVSDCVPQRTGFLGRNFFTSQHRNGEIAKDECILCERIHQAPAVKGEQIINSTLQDLLPKELPKTASQP